MKRTAGLIIALLCFIISLFFDKQISLFVAAHRTIALNIFFTIISHMGTLIPVLIIAISIYFWSLNKKDLIMPLWLSVGATIAITYLLKYSVGRARPFAALSILALTNENPNTSFPSAHTSACFSAIAIIRRFKNLKYVWITFAVLVGISRVYLGVHYLSDIIFAAVLGHAIGLLIANAPQPWVKKVNVFENKKWIR